MNTEKFYPLKFRPILKDKIWGGNRIQKLPGKPAASDYCGESWELSGVQENISVVKNGFLAKNNLQELIEVFMGDLVGDKIYEKYGNEFPLLVKFIDATRVLSVQVHPDDELAMQRHKAYGKTEMWYILDADPGAEIISGFNRELNRSEYLGYLNSGKLPEVLNRVEVRPGDVFFTPAGRVHAIGAGILLAEIQQTSDVTYRIYDWDRKDEQGKGRELHTALATDAIDFSKPGEIKTSYRAERNQTTRLIDCPYFRTSLVHLDKPVEKDFIMIDSFVIYLCVEGKVAIQYDMESPGVSLSKGETVLIPASLKNIHIKPEQSSGLLEVWIP